ncbi:MAG: ion channel, partial [Actinomycetota bacterium]
MDPFRRLRQSALLAVAALATLAGGTIGFHQILDETWFQSFYRSIITATLTGLDTVPPNDAARGLSIVMALCGLTIIGYAGAVIVETISGGVLTGAIAERRMQKRIEDLHDHYIIAGYGRVGRRVGEEMRASGVAYVVVDWSDEAREAARE